MKLSLRNVALILGAVALLGLIPDTFNLQSPRDEHLVIAARDNSDLPFELPLAAVIQPVPTLAPLILAPAVTKEITDSLDQRDAVRTFIAPPRPYESLDLYIHLPPDAAKRQPLRILIVLHGVGSRGDTFSQSLIEEADRNSWLLVAPTMPYRDYMDPANLLTEDIRFSALLTDMLDNLPKKLGMKLRRHVLVFGFSRGAQLAHRFSIFNPDRVEAVAAISAGAYTLPSDHRNNDQSAPLIQMPFGVGDLEKYIGHPLNRDLLKQVSFLLEVGGRDVEPDEVPRQFDTYVGKNRVARAYAFQYALVSAGVKSHLIVFPDAGHEVTAEMRQSALKFLRDDELTKKLND